MSWAALLSVLVLEQEVSVASSLTGACLWEALPAGVREELIARYA